MDVYETRRLRLRQLIDEKFDGVVKRCAEALDMKPPQLHRWLSITSKDSRRIEYDSARGIEEKLDLVQMWMDGPEREKSHTPQVNETTGSYDLGKLKDPEQRWPFKRIPAQRFFALLPDEREAIEERVEQWVEAYEARSRKGPSKAGS